MARRALEDAREEDYRVKDDRAEEKEVACPPERGAGRDGENSSQLKDAGGFGKENCGGVGDDNDIAKLQERCQWRCQWRNE